MKRCLSFLLFFFAIVGCNPDCNKGSKSNSDKITISGAWALYPMMVRWAEEYKTVDPDLRIDISAGGAGKGMADALSETVDLGMVSRNINKAEIEKGAWWVSVVKDAVIPTMNSDNPHCERLLKKGLTKSEIRKIWIEGTITAWNDIISGEEVAPIHVYTRSDACGAAETWANYAGGSQEDLKGVGVYGDPGLAESVRNDQYSIGYNNINFAYDAKTKKPINGIIPIPLDINGNGRIDPSEHFYADRDLLMNAVAQNVYPAPPARDLHLVSHGVPRNEKCVAFLKWILGEGQRFAAETGYTPMSPGILRVQLKKLTH